MHVSSKPGKKLQQVIGKAAFSAKFSGENSEKVQFDFYRGNSTAKNQVNIFLTNLYYLRVIDAILNNINDNWYLSNSSNVKYDFFHDVFGVVSYYIKHLNTLIK